MGASDSGGRGHQPLVRDVVMAVYGAIREKGAHDPVRQIAGYLLSGEPAYITGFKGARALIVTVERDHIIEELVRAYFATTENGGAAQDTAGWLVPETKE